MKNYGIKCTIYYALKNNNRLNEKAILNTREGFIKDPISRKAIRFLKALYAADEDSFHIICNECMRTIKFIEKNMVE